MNEIKFNDVTFKMPYLVTKQNSTIRFEIMKEDYTLSQIMPLISGVEQIQVLENEKVISIYSGYTEVISIQVIDDYTIGSYDAKGSVVSVVLANTDIQSQIDALTAQLSSVQESQVTTDAAIAELGDTVETITPYTAEKTGYIGDTEVIFEDVPNGIITAFAENTEGNSIECETKKSGNDVIVSFQPLEYVTTISISIS